MTVASEKSWQQWIDKLSLRERAIVLVAGLLVIYGIWHLVWFSGASAERQELLARQNSTESQIASVTQEIDLLNRVLSGDASSEKQRQLAVLEARVEQLDSDLARLAQGLVPAADLSIVLRDLLEETEGLTLRTLSTGPVEQLNFDEATNEEAGNDGASVYKHPVNLTFEGGYFAVMQFVERLESLDWRLYFDRLQYRVSDYPRAEVELGVYTLSAERGNLSVEP